MRENEELQDTVSMRIQHLKQLKVQLFHALHARGRHSWARYWHTWQQYLVATLSLEEFHAVASELLGPDQLQLHNTFVVGILVYAHHQDELPEYAFPQEEIKRGGSNAPDGVTIQEDVHDVKCEEMSAKIDPLSASPSSPLKVEPFPTHASKKRPYNCISNIRVSDENDPCVFSVAVKKLLHFANSNVHHRHQEDEETYQQSAELLIGLGKHESAFENPSRGRQDNSKNSSNAGHNDDHFGKETIIEAHTDAVDIPVDDSQA